MKILIALALLAISSHAASRWELQINSSTGDDYLLDDEKADEEFFAETRLAWPDVDFWDKVGGARAESYRMELEKPDVEFWISVGNYAKEAEDMTLEFPENDDRAAPVAGIAFKPSTAEESERNSRLRNPEGDAIETRATVKVGKPDIWNL